MSSLFLDWRAWLAQPWANIVLAIVAILCGSIVGAERERKEKPAGLRTLTLVTLGSAVFTMLSIAMTRDKGDPGRIASQIVTGIGFLGGGAILRNTGVVTGMTTAATIWVMAAMGMVVGCMGFRPRRLFGFVYSQRLRLWHGRTGAFQFFLAAGGRQFSSERHAIGELRAWLERYQRTNPLRPLVERV